MFVCYVDLFLYFPRGIFTVRAAIISIGNDLIVDITEYSLALLTFLRIVERDTVANRTSNELILKKTLIGNPFFIDSDQLRIIALLYLLRIYIL